MFRKWYIKHVDVVNPENGTAYIGPFDDFEIVNRLNDELADMFACSGELEAVRLPLWKRIFMYINPPEWWIQELHAHERWLSDA